MNRCVRTFLIGLACVLLFPGSVFGADIFLTADKNEIRVGDTVSVTVQINTLGENVNSAEGLLSFPTDIFSVESISMGGSVFSIWVEQPSFSNNAGTISFNGGSPNPGFNGSRGSVIRATLKAKKIGTGNILFNSAGVYANDGLGTDIVSAKKGTQIVVLKNDVPAIIPPTPTVSSVPSAPQIVSSDMPDPEKWYSKNRAVFTWNTPSQTTSTQLLLGSFSSSIPTITYTPPIGNKEVTGLNDGVSYLHVRFANASGWGDTAHRKIKVDTTSPTDLSVVANVSNDDRVLLSLSASDRTSGVQGYKVYYNSVVIAESGARDNSQIPVEVLLSPLEKGPKDISVRVYDKAGNYTEKNISVEIPALKIPVITKYSEVITKGERIHVSGTTYSSGDVQVFVQSGDLEVKKYIVSANNLGEFVFVSDEVSNIGLTSVWVKAYRSDTVVSDSSARVSTQVNKTLVVRGSMYAVDALFAIIPLIFLVFVLLFTTYYGWHKFFRLRGHLNKDFENMEEKTHRAFKVLSTETSEQLAVLEKARGNRSLTKSEEKAIKDLKNAISQIDLYIEGQMKKLRDDDL